MIGGKTLCLNMIVRNEMGNLERCLNALVDHIDCWVIGDTGSSDGTQDFIRSFFAERGKPGELHSFPFQNFEQARNAALDCAYGAPLYYDYLLLADADMELMVEDTTFRERLEAPGYQLLQRPHSGFAYWNARLIRRNAGARYHGVTHEYIDVTGGTQRLEGVWYKDHASGSNRAGKFERDIDLLSAALEQDQGNGRYWFYLGQSYRDAGRATEAAQAYAKRAEMGGWDEEVWNARLQEARCLRQLGDEGGFVRQALAAFNMRPQRAEPLYDLARFYREKGMYAASVVFSEAGLTIERPKEDILFLEDFVYTAGLQEEYSIAANYARDPARKDRGFAACNWLALNRAIPDRSRGLARWNLFFYVKPASAMLPTFTTRRVGFDLPSGYRPLNPSVTRSDQQIVLLLRTTNCQPIEDGHLFQTPDNAPGHTRNFLLRLSYDLEIQSAAEVLPPVDMPQPAYPWPGLEDFRLFTWRGELWGSAGFGELTAEGWCEQLLARIDEPGSAVCRLTDWRVLRPSGPGEQEKNWMPAVAGDCLQFICLCDPTRVVDDRGSTVTEATAAIAADEFRGGSQLIAFDGGWLALIHEVQERDGRRFYHHRFVWFDHTQTLHRVSRPFFFHKKGVEFAAGLAWHPDGERLLISYGVEESEAWIATVDAGDVQGVLEDAGHPPSGNSEPAGAAAVDLPRLGGPRREFNSTSLSTQKKPLVDAIDRVSEDQSEELIELDESRGIITSPPLTTRSSWVPPAPAGGTELMVEGLIRRLGADLNRINLKVNRFDISEIDSRPLVVWFHLDIDQGDVSWCRDHTLVGMVSCYVFVSNWQRERYIQTFGLQPDRCVVLRNATEVPRISRRWVTGPPWRCAYTSTPYRGLSVLLEAWDRLRPSDAELHIWSSTKLYGWGDDEKYKHLYERADSLPGVVYHGITSNGRLRAALNYIHFLTYPSTFEETSGLAVIEAMAAGCRVIAPYLGALPETTAGYARLYPSSINEGDHAAAFGRALATEMANPWNGDPELTVAQQRHCAMIYGWRRRVNDWYQLIDEISGGDSDHAIQSF